MDETGWLWYRGLRHYLGKWRFKEFMAAKRQWKRDNPEPPLGYICALCGRRIRLTYKRRAWQTLQYDDLTIDHIIPIDIIIERDLDVNLWFAPENLQAAHQLCNSRKGSKYTQLDLDKLTMLKS